ncbi:MAG: group 1 truncated hemoglobin [Gammaproteobacteria bacterium]|nr:group 1 truncated hemoglobin [Gammaproteobacteria bacterium]MDH5800632.1 group 1 truncated hemoglobin [Gammaproteobacteria bacterium]
MIIPEKSTQELKQSLFDAVGGLESLERVHKIFYDKVYAHPWLGLFFQGHNQTFIENRQTRFMAQKMGGPKLYRGREIQLAHRHMYITKELFDLRQELLRQSLQGAGIAKPLVMRWLAIDAAFYRKICKNSIEEFYQTSWKYDKRRIHPRPD